LCSMGSSSFSLSSPRGVREGGVALSFSVVIFIFGFLYSFNSSEEQTTDTEDSAIANPAT